MFQEATPQQVELFVKTAVARLTAGGKMTEDQALEKVAAVLNRRASELGLVHPDQIKQAEYDQGAADAEALIQQMMQEKRAEQLAGTDLTAEEYVLGLAHEKLVKAGMAEDEALNKLIAHLSR